MIIYFYILVILHTLIISSSLLTMHHASRIYSTTNDTHLFSVVCSKNKIFIAGSEGIQIYNNTTEKITTLSDKPTLHMAMHPHYKNVAISNEIELAVYDTNTEQKKWVTQKPLCLWKSTPITFGPTDDVIYSYRKGTFTLHHYKPLPLKLFTIPYNAKESAYCIQIACHPNKKEFLYPSGKQTVSIAEPNRFREIKETVTSPQNNYIFSTLYNPNATIIAMNDTSGQCSLYDIVNNSFDLLQHSSPSAHSNYISMVFHPHKNIVALLTNNNSIHYWHYKTKQLIAITDTYAHEDESTETIHFSRTKRLDFFPDGKFLAVAFLNTCHKLPTPLNNLMMMYYLLNSELPHDVIKLIITIIPHVLELQYLNFFELLKI